jgi:hypothetical protein
MPQEAQPTPQEPPAYAIAADARIPGRTRPQHDTVWRAVLAGEQAALSLQTELPGQVGLLALVPAWTVGRERIVRDYRQPLRITAYFPDLIALDGALTDGVMLSVECWAAASDRLALRFTLANTGSEPAPIEAALSVFVAPPGPAADTLRVTSAVLSASAGDVPGLSGLTWRTADLACVVAVEGGGPIAVEPGVLPRIGQAFTLAPGETRTVRAVYAAAATGAASAEAALGLLATSWDEAFRAVAALDDTLPALDTGDAAWNTVIARSYHLLVQSLMAAPGAGTAAPRFTLISPRGAGAPPEAGAFGLFTRHLLSSPVGTLYTAALALAAFMPAAARDQVRTLLAQPDAPPLAARMAWAVFQYTEDEAFLEEIFPAARAALERWLSPAHDRDGDGYPEWPDARQSGAPLRALRAERGPLLETPDLLAMLLSETLTLGEIGYYLRKPADPSLDGIRDRLAAHLNAQYTAETGVSAGAEAGTSAGAEAAVQEARGQYEGWDRDTHRTAETHVLLENGAGGEDIPVGAQLDQAVRLAVTIEGGRDRRPNFTVSLFGRDAAGNAIEEHIEASAIPWNRSIGRCVTARVFRDLDRVHTPGLVRVYRVSIATYAPRSRDLGGLLPLWTPLAALPDAPAQDARTRLAALIAQAQAAYLTPHGLAWEPPDEASAAPNPIDLFWNTLIGEGLIESGAHEAAAQLVQRLLGTLAAHYAAHGMFGEAALAPSGERAGTPDHIAGIAPLYLLLRVFGVRIVSPTLVWVGGPFVWPHPVHVRLHGVHVARTAAETTVTFPTGAQVSLAADAPMQPVADRRSGETQ